MFSCGRLEAVDRLRSIVHLFNYKTMNSTPIQERIFNAQSREQFGEFVQTCKDFQVLAEIKDANAYVTFIGEDDAGSKHTVSVRMPPYWSNLALASGPFVAELIGTLTGMLKADPALGTKIKLLDLVVMFGTFLVYLNSSSPQFHQIGKPCEARRG